MAADGERRWWADRLDELVGLSGAPTGTGRAIGYVLVVVAPGPHVGLGALRALARWSKDGRHPRTLDWRRAGRSRVGTAPAASINGDAFEPRRRHGGTLHGVAIAV